ncbi:hypothetical protein BDV93DRAFT_48781 [Ceratobasidium sp. AG-I]|nr:hypothetical protein BDV93DRAFT_48781 [Ceratobasidium sp. AG-I]
MPFLDDRTVAEKLSRAKDALTVLQARLKGRSRENANMREKKSRERSRLRLYLSQLESANLVQFLKSPTSMSLEELRVLYEEHRHLHLFKSLDLNKLRRQACTLCSHNDPNALPDYTQTCPSAIPFIPGMLPSGSVSMDDFNSHYWILLENGTTVGTLAVPDSETPEIAIFVYIPEVDAISPEIKELAQILHQGATMGTRCKSNSAHKAAGSRGFMNVLGWRRAYDASPWGLYVPPANFQGNAEKMAEWGEYVQNMRRIQHIFNKEFTSIIVAKIAHEAQAFVADSKLPAFGETLADSETHQPSLGCNFTISFGGFCNEPHLDNDAFRFVFSVYVFVDSQGNLVTDRALIEGCLSGGYFLWPDLHLALDPSKCNGVVLFLWRGTHERHCTMECELLDNGVTRYGTSIQVNGRLLASVLRYHQEEAQYQEDMEAWVEGGRRGKKPTAPVKPTGLPE